MKQPTPWWMWLLPLPIVWWFALITVGVWRPGMDLMRLMEELSTALEQPWNIRWSEYSGRCLLLFSFVYAVAVGMVRSSVTATRRGEEHGSAHWGDVFGIARRYRDKRGGNLILTQHFTIGWDGYRHKHNINVLVVGGSGAGKTRGYCVPNILEAAGRNKNAPPCSLVVTDPKSEVLRKTGALLIARGYEVRVLDLTSPATSFCYNPLQYIQSDKDALRMIDTLIQATTPPGSKNNDPFWEKSETALLFITVLSFVMIMTVYGRLFRLYFYAALAPVPLATFAGEPTSNVGRSFVKSYAGVCLEGAVIALACIIFSAMASAPPAVDNSVSAVTAVWSYVAELIFNLLILVGAVKASDRVVREMMGL